MQALYYITQLPQYRKQLLRQIEVLKIAEGFNTQEKADLLQIYNDLLNKISQMLDGDNRPKDVREIEVNNPVSVK